MKLLTRLTAEAWLTGALFLASLLALVFMGALVAEPKALFGRSLSAIPPSLFPTLVLSGLAVLSGAQLVVRGRALLQDAWHPVDVGGLNRALLLFAVMLFYALTMVPFGFLISTALSLAAISWVAGNRSIPLILVLSLVSPVVLYLVATRGLAVSLPELSPIEFAYQRLFDLFDAAPAVPEAPPVLPDTGAAQ